MCMNGMDVLPAGMPVQCLGRPKECVGCPGAGFKNSTLSILAHLLSTVYPLSAFLHFYVYKETPFSLKNFPFVFSSLAICLVQKIYLLDFFCLCLLFEIRPLPGAQAGYSSMPPIVSEHAFWNMPWAGLPKPSTSLKGSTVINAQ